MNSRNDLWWIQTSGQAFRQNKSSDAKRQFLQVFINFAPGKQMCEGSTNLFYKNKLVHFGRHLYTSPLSPVELKWNKSLIVHCHTAHPKTTYVPSALLQIQEFVSKRQALLISPKEQLSTVYVSHDKYSYVTSTFLDNSITVTLFNTKHFSTCVDF